MKAIGWSIAFVVLTFLLASVLGYGIALLVTGSNPEALAFLETIGPGAMLLQAVVMLACAALFTWLIGVRVLGLTRADLRYPEAGAGSSGFGFGLLAGALTAGAALLIGVAAGDARWVPDQGGAADYLGQAALTVLVLAPAALSEEVIFRGVPLVLLAYALGRGAAIPAVAVPFALAHLLNPNLTALGVGNIALAGIFLGLAFYAPGGIWTASGAHLGWNGVLACLDTPVSGVPFDIPLLDYRAGGPVWLTGGAFGPEGGLGATIALTLAIYVTARWARSGKGTT
ncbi:MAG: CPBP family intramembrane metalloprotease [Gemmatimonadales bacterium]|nr:CPBP family intramembrane metalloprotease [Gemmatimonadales bacterium]MBA3555313.1 CPBP family intramembrane metalloprotease [Gemmatimonadales bacterium]